MTLKAQTAATS